MAKCSECRIARLTADGSCRYCDRAKARVSPDRNIPIDGVLRTFIAASVVVNALVFGFRAVIYVLSYLAVGDLRSGDFAALDRIHTYGNWMRVDWWATIASGIVLGRLRRRWMDAANANALTRPDIGLGWFRGMPSSKAFHRWQWVQVFGYLSIVAVNIVFSRAVTNPDHLRAWAVLEVLLCLVVIAGSVGGTVSARRMTAQLLERIELSGQASRTARTMEPDPIA